MESQAPADWGDKVMHATFVAGSVTLPTKPETIQLQYSRR
jgi:hypothetical protein